MGRWLGRVLLTSILVWLWALPMSNSPRCPSGSSLSSISKNRPCSSTSHRRLGSRSGACFSVGIGRDLIFPQWGCSIYAGFHSINISPLPRWLRRFQRAGQLHHLLQGVLHEEQRESTLLVHRPWTAMVASSIPYAQKRLPRPNLLCHFQIPPFLH